MQNSRRLTACLVLTSVVFGIWLTKALADQQRHLNAVEPTPLLRVEATHSQATQPPPKPDASSVTSQKKGPVDYSKFNHADHAGEVRKLVGKGTLKLDCVYCHSVDASEKNMSGFGKYPCENPETIKKMAKGPRRVLHSACVDCHGSVPIMAKQHVDLCLICHVAYGVKPHLPLNPYPNPKVTSEFSLNFPHKQHRRKVTFASNGVSLLDGLASLHPTSLSLGGGALAPAPTFACTACHSIEAEGTFAVKPQHRECFVCHMEAEKLDERYKSLSNTPYANDCAGCHPKASTNPFKDSPHTTSYRTVEVKQTDDSGKVNGGPLFRHDGDHAVGTKIGATGKSLTCLLCHGNIIREPARADMSADERMKFLITPYPESCSGCHVFKGKLVVGYSTKSNTFKGIFNASKCDRCHTSEIQNKDSDYHNKQQGPAK